MDTSERDFEACIEGHLLSSGFARRRSDQFSRALCLDAEMTLQFVKATQTQAWMKLKSQFAEGARDHFLGTLTKAIQQRGTLDVLRKGISDHGAKFELAYFKPETTLNEEHQRRYQNNLFSIIRQVHFSEKNESSVDLVLFLNGLPIITAELKNPLKGQTVHNAVSQYRHRDPREALLTFGRTLAHFAIDTDLVFMTTHLKGKDTFFLPFNLGNNCALKLPVKHQSISNHDDRIKNGFVLFVVKTGDAVCEPGNTITFATACAVLDQVIVSRSTESCVIC